MHVHFAYHNIHRSAQLDKIIASNVRKIGRLLVRFSPDLVHLHGVLESNGTRPHTICSLTLALPAAKLHAKREGSNLFTDLQQCFDHLEEQVKKHKQSLRNEKRWRKEPVNK